MAASREVAAGKTNVDAALCAALVDLAGEGSRFLFLMLASLLASLFGAGFMYLG